jgi:hypothetical protein
MGLAEGIDTIFAIKDANDSIATLQSFADFGNKLIKLKPEELKKAHTDFFSTSETKAILKVMTAAEKSVVAIGTSSVDWPDSKSMAAFQKAVDAAKKYGHDSKETKAAIEAYKKILIAYSRKLADIVKILKALSTEVKDRKKACETLHAVGVICVTTLEKLAKVPSSQQAEFFVLSRAIVPVRDVSGRVSTKLIKVHKVVLEGIADGNELIQQNLVWILWCNKDAMKSEKSMMSNLKAKTLPVRK